MQTVNFNCPHCGNLMAVGTNLLGRNVRCPHCKQVLRAPAAAGAAPAPPVPTPPPPPLPTFKVPEPAEHHESIFGERHDEDLFGTEAPKPTLPPDPPAAAGAQPLDPTVSMPAPPPPVPRDPLRFETTATLAPPEAPAPFDGPVALNLPTPAAAAEEADTRPRRVSAREPAPATPAFAWIMLGYAVVATVLAGFFGFKYATADTGGEHPFRAIPDVIREYDPAKKRQVSFRGLPDPKQEVPPDLRVKLGDSLVVGDLQVTPTAVERQKLEAVTVPAAGDPRSRSIGETLVLTLRVKNLSADTVFHPNDPAFNRVADKSQPAPYTALQVQRSLFFYGVFKWPPEPGTQKEYVAGHEADENPLNPGEERDTWVAVGPHGVRAATGDIIRTLQDKDLVKPADWLLWRVQLRRGLVRAKGPDGRETDISATAVVGVEFRADEIGNNNAE